MRKWLLAATLAFGLAGPILPILIDTPAQAQATTTTTAPPRVASTRPVRVDAVDGDTVRRNGVLIRVVGVDTPELRGKCEAERAAARLARDRVAEIGRAGVAIEVVPRRDRYGRTLAILRDRQGRNVAEILIAEGLGRPYDGRGARASWCPA